MAMDNHRLVLLIGVAGVVLAGCAGASEADQRAGGPTSAPLMPSPAATPLPEPTQGALGQVLEDWLAAEGFPGVTAAVVSPDGTWAGAAGVDGVGTALQPDSAMAIASITKTFTAAEVMLLSARGLVDLDAPVVDYVELPFDARGATVRQLLNMSSGFPTDPLEAFNEAVLADPDHDYAVGDEIALVDPDASRMGAVGYGQEYNNLNYAVLGELIEQVTDGLYADAIRADLLDRTDLERVWVQDDETPTDPIAIGETLPQLPVVDEDSPWLPSRAYASLAGAEGGIAADAPTIAQWGALLYGGHVIDASLVEQMTTGLQADDDWYGLGTARGQFDGEPWVGHQGDIVSYHGKLTVFPDTATSVAYLVPAPATYRFTPVLLDTDLAVQIRDAAIAARP
jgi:D-alanyl-D-alanine carboxypeptidase